MQIEIDAGGTINPDLYINRELSWIEFNRRVLEEARDERNPLLERVKFAAIFHSNLDEFFMVRVSGVKEQIDRGVSGRTPNGFTPSEQFAAIRAALLPLVGECQEVVCDVLLPALAAQGIVVAHYTDLNPQQRQWVDDYYLREIFPVLTPLVVDPTHRFPFISNLSLSLAVVLDVPDAGKRFARVKVPQMLPRLIMLPPALSDAAGDGDGDGPGAFGLGAAHTGGAGTGGGGVATLVWLEDVIAANVGTLFVGRNILTTVPFRVTRDADVEIREYEAADLLQAMEENVRRRRFGDVVRLEIGDGMTPDIRTMLGDRLELNHDDLYAVRGPLGLSALMELYGLDRPDLKDPPFVPQTPKVLRNQDIFAAIRSQDVALHHPFDSFQPVIDLVRAAAVDPHVMAIKMTLYRVGRNSPIVQALMEAVENGKQVAVLVELKARFDEASNIGWARALEATGAHVVYGLPGLKVHSKLLMIVRREAEGLRRYLHLGTGNYNATTARMYTDFSLMTADESFGADVAELFNMLTGSSKQQGHRSLLVAPLDMHRKLLAKIEREIRRQEKHGDGRLIFKCNGLTDEEMTAALYRAAQAGVRVDLLVRGVCSVRPGIPGLSECMTVRSIVGRFLEHHRFYYFYNGGDEELYAGSADLMDRNLHRRIETLFPIKDAKLLRHLRDDVLELYLRDNTQARELRPDGTYVRITPGDALPVNAQMILLSAGEHGR
jgi:polyphosphate kinase